MGWSRHSIGVDRVLISTMAPTNPGSLATRIILTTGLDEQVPKALADQVEWSPHYSRPPNMLFLRQMYRYLLE